MSCGNCTCESCKRWNEQMMHQRTAQQLNMHAFAQRAMASRPEHEAYRRYNGDATEQADKFALLEKEIVAEACKLWGDRHAGAESDLRAAEVCILREGLWKKKRVGEAEWVAFDAAVARYIKARIEDERR